MAKKAPGKHRDGISLVGLKNFPMMNPLKSGLLKPDGRISLCNDSDNVTSARHPTMPYRCKGKHFSVSDAR